MQYRRLGRTGLLVSEIGFGTWGLGGRTAGATSYGPTDDAVSRQALEAALDNGINFFDTSNVYGNGHSEELLGEAFRRRRDEIVIATKAGWISYGREDYTAVGLRRSLEGSLRRLATDHVDLLQLHNATIETFTRNPDLLPLFGDLEREGKIRSWGISARAPSDALALLAALDIPVVQANLNLMDQRAVRCGLLGICERRQIGFIARTPLCFGMLGGKVDAATSFDPSDHRSRWPREQIQRWIEGSRLFVEAAAARDSQTRAQIALRYCLSHPAVSTVIPGMLTPEEVCDNTVASALGPMSPAELDRIDRIYAGNDFFVAPARAG